MRFLYEKEDFFESIAYFKEFPYLCTIKFLIKIQPYTDDMMYSTKATYHFGS